MTPIREHIRQLIEEIHPFDAIEQVHRDIAIDWIASGVEIFRVEKPAIPPKHLVSYFAVIDTAQEKILLVDHIKAELWLPAGGHVEQGEDPKMTVEREAQEELGITANFLSEKPFFLTESITVGKTAGHTDVSLWYVLTASADDPIHYDPGEFNGYRWFSFDEILSSDISHFDPHLHRFLQKLKACRGNIDQVIVYAQDGLK